MTKSKSKEEKQYQRNKVAFAMDVLAIKKRFVPENFREVLNKLKEIIPDLGTLIHEYDFYSDTQTFDDFIIERSDRPRNGRPWIDSKDYKKFRQKNDDFFKNKYYIDAIKYYSSKLSNRQRFIAHFLNFPTYLGWDEVKTVVTFYFCNPERQRCSRFDICKEKVRNGKGPLCPKYSTPEPIEDLIIRKRFERMQEIKRY